MALNFCCFGMTLRRDRDDLDDMTPSMASDSPPPAAAEADPLEERAGPLIRPPPPLPPRLRARYMHIGRIMSGTDGVMMKMCDDWQGSDAGVPVNACSLAVFGRNGRISTPASIHHSLIRINVVTIGTAAAAL